MDEKVSDPFFVFFSEVKHGWKQKLSEPLQSPPLPPIRRLSLAGELLLILIIVTTYCRGFLNLNTLNTLPGNESDVFQSLDKILETSMKSGEFPLWNPLFGYGMPYLADPMTHVFNPLVSVPVILLGALDGFKLGLYFGFLTAAFGMWWLGRILGLKGIARVWIALMFAFAGPPIARFFQGQYLFTLGYGFLPWCLAGVIAAYRYQRPAYYGIAILSIGLLFFTGNIYYPYYFLYVLAIFGLTHLLLRRKTSFFINKQLLKTYAIIGFLTLGLISIQLFPVMEFRHSINKSPLELNNSHSFYQIWLDLTSKDTRRSDAVVSLPPEEFYAYIGYWGFITLAALPLAWKRMSDQRLILFFVILILFFSLWINFAILPWRNWMLHTHFFSQFRYPTRLLPLLILSILSLAGLSLDAFLEKLSVYRSEYARYSKQSVSSLFVFFMVLTFLTLSTADLYKTNRYHIHTVPYNPKEDTIAGWLKSYDNGFYATSTFDNRWHIAMIENSLPHYDMWYHFLDVRRYDEAMYSRFINPIAKYSIIDVAFPQPENTEVIKKFEFTVIYKNNGSLPFAFVIPTEVLVDPQQTDSVQPHEVSPVNQLNVSFNRIDFWAEGKNKSTVVVLSTWYPGWRLTIDGKFAQITNTNGFMAASMPEGEHHYIFTFRPTGFWAGAAISALSLFCVVFIFASEHSTCISWLQRLIGKLLPKQLHRSTTDNDLETSRLSGQNRSKIIDTDPTSSPRTPVKDWLKRSIPFLKKENSGEIHHAKSLRKKPNSAMERMTDTSDSQHRIIVTENSQNISIPMEHQADRENITIQISVNLPIGARVQFTIASLDEKESLSNQTALPETENKS